MQEKVRLNPGLALIRYDADGHRNYNAQIEVDLPPGVFAVFDPTCDGAVLAHPGQCAVVRCETPTTISLRVKSTAMDRPTRGSVSIEYIPTYRGDARRGHGRNAEQMGQSGMSAGVAGASGGSNAVSIIGHIANLGDNKVSGGQWLGAAGAKSPIEGFQINWPRCPVGVKLMQCDLSSGQTCQAGDFLGSRGQAKPMSGFELWLEGRVPEELSLSVEAVFERRGTVKKQAKWVEMTGADAMDPLIALKFDVRVEGENESPFDADPRDVYAPQARPRENAGATFLSENEDLQRKRKRIFR